VPGHRGLHWLDCGHALGPLETGHRTDSPARLPHPMRRTLLSLALLTTLPLLGFAAAQDNEAKPETETDAAAESPDEVAVAEAPAPAKPSFAFAESLEAARADAEASGKSLLVVAVPDWYESPGWKRLEKAMAGDDETARALGEFVGVLVKESRDHEVHVRHRVPLQGYPLAIVLGPNGDYLGHTSGTPAEGEEAGWVALIAAIPPRAQKIAALREKLFSAPEDPALLFDLAKLLDAAGETERADALFERMERADPLGPADRIGEARYLRLRHRVLGLLKTRKFGDVEPLCLRWRRRFSSHARLPDLLLLQANARFLAGKADDARALWKTIVDDHADTDAAKVAKKALEKLAD